MPSEEGELGNVCVDEWKAMYPDNIVPEDHLYTDEFGLTWKGFCDNTIYKFGASFVTLTVVSLMAF